VPYSRRPGGPEPEEDVVVDVSELIVSAEELEIVVPEELEIVEELLDVSGGGVDPAWVGPASGKAGSFVRIRIESKDVVPRSAKSPNPPSTRMPLKAWLKIRLPFTRTLIVRPFTVIISE
jgi:hypothetical protein